MLISYHALDTLSILVHTVSEVIIVHSESDEREMQFTPDKLVVLGPAFDFWLNPADDVYDQLYGSGQKKETLEGHRND